MKDFSQVIGHREVIGHLQKGIQENKVSHAYILAGEQGSGKRLLADIFANTLQCQKGSIELAEHVLPVYRRQGATSRILSM